MLNRPFHIIGRSTQMLPNNWKLYFENVKDTYHASILHLVPDDVPHQPAQHAGQHQHRPTSGGNHFSHAKLDYAAEDADYKAATIALRHRSQTAGPLGRASPSTSTATASRCRS